MASSHGVSHLTVLRPRWCRQVVDVTRRYTKNYGTQLSASWIAASVVVLPSHTHTLTREPAFRICCDGVLCPGAVLSRRTECPEAWLQGITALDTRRADKRPRRVLLVVTKQATWPR